MNSSDDITGPINLGNTEEYNMLELAEKIIKIIGSKSKIEFFKIPQDDPKKRKPDIEKAKKILNWEPSITLDDGLLNTINFFKEAINNK